MSEVNGSKLLARGALIDLGDGVQRRVIFDLEALLVLEERCGSIHAYLDGISKGMKGRFLRSALAGLAGGLAHDLTATEARIRSVVFEAYKRPGELQRIVDVLDAAWDEAHHIDEEPSPSGKDSAPESTSPGQSSTEGAPLTMAAPTPSSGA